MESVKTALRVLELVAEAGEVGVSELARLTGEPKTTVQRNLTTLHEAGWLMPVLVGQRRKWALSTRLPLIASKMDRVTNLRHVALPVMEALRTATSETVHLTLREDRDIVLVERLETPHTLRIVRAIGSRAPLHVAANGKAILAHLPDAEIDEYLGGKLEAWTKKTLTTRQALAGEIALIREKGYAHSNGELDLNVRTVAAAILSGGSVPIGSLSLSCPASRLTDDLVEDYGAQVSAAARRISEKL